MRNYKLAPGSGSRDPFKNCCDRSCTIDHQVGNLHVSNIIQEIRSVERGYLSHCFKSRSWPWPCPLLGSFIIDCMLLSAMDLTEKTRSLWPKIEIQDGGRTPSWICYVIISDHPQSPFISPHRPVKFYANPMYSFEDMTIWNFCRFGLKCLFSPKNFGFFGAKIGEGIFGFRPQPNQFFRFGPQRFLPNFVKIGWKMRP